MQLFSSLNILWHCPSLGLEWKLTFSSPVVTVAFSKLAGILSAALSQHILLGPEYSSGGILSPPLTLFVLILPKPHFTSHPRISHSRWVIHHRGYLGHKDLFLYSSSVYSCHLFLITSASVRFIPFLSFIVPIFAWNTPLVSLMFLKRYLIFPILLFYFISLHWSLMKVFLSLLAILWNFAFKWVYLSFSPFPFASLLFLAICMASSENYFAILHFFFLGIVLLLAFCTMSWTCIHSSSDTLSDLIPWIYSSLPLYNHKRFDFSHTRMVCWFSPLYSIQVWICK